mgnify:CR=1 FL=1
MFTSPVIPDGKLIILPLLQWAVVDDSSQRSQWETCYSVSACSTPDPYPWTEVRQGD